MSNYKIVADEQEVTCFANWLPELLQTELYYVTLMSRAKYLKDKVTGWGTNTDRLQCARFLTKPEWLLGDLAKLEIPLGGYRRKDTSVPPESLAAYITPRPRDLKAAMKTLTLDLVTKLAEDTACNPVELALTMVHKSRSRATCVDFDFDLADADAINSQKVFEFVNPEAVTLIETRGGFHVLVDPGKVSAQYKNTWYKNISSLPGCDACGDNMIPIPGTFQGGFVPQLFKPGISEDGKFTGWVK